MRNPVREARKAEVATMALSKGAKYIKDAETVAFPVESMDFAPELCGFIAIFAQS